MQASLNLPTAQSFWFNRLAALVLGTGISLHTARLVFGTDWLLQNVLTPAFDMALAVPMTFAALCMWAFRSRVQFTGRAHRVLYYVVAVYFTGSLPLHIQTFVTGSTEYIRVFPMWFSFVIIWVQLGFAIVMWRTRLSHDVHVLGP